MPSKEEVFKQRFDAIMADMGDEVPPDDVLMVGSLASQLVEHAQVRTWSRFKLKLTKTNYGALLKTFQNQGNSLARQGALQQVHAIEVLACSLIARTQVHDPAILADDKRLDAIIDSAIEVYRNSRTTGSATS
jgi:hypothetical protein